MRRTDDYFAWLCSIISPRFRGNDYYMMLQDLFTYEYVWYDDLDKNRYFDAIALRDEFGLYIGKQEVSVLEVLIALAGRMDDIMFDVEVGIIVEKWFWELICNFGLEIYDDSNYNSVNIGDIIADWVENPYMDPHKKLGVGRKKSGGRAKNTDLWYKMQEYLDDNYGF